MDAESGSGTVLSVIREAAMATRENESRIVAVEEMPKRRLGRPRIDLAPLKEALRDGTPHALTDIGNEQERKLWRRRLRMAAKELGLGVETVFVKDEARLYFQGRNGDTPSSGRRRTRGRRGSNSE